MSNGKRIIDYTDQELESLLARIIQKHLKEGEGNSEQQLKPFMSVQECSDYTGFSVQTLYQKASSRTIPYSKKGGKLFFNRKEIDAWISAGKKLSVENI